MMSGKNNVDDDGDKGTCNEYHKLFCSSMIMMMMMEIMTMWMMLVLGAAVCSKQAYRPYRLEQRSLSVRSCNVCM